LLPTQNYPQSAMLCERGGQVLSWNTSRGRGIPVPALQTLLGICAIKFILIQMQNDGVMSGMTVALTHWISLEKNIGRIILFHAMAHQT
jgi:hypothetical protein